MHELAIDISIPFYGNQNYNHTTIIIIEAPVMKSAPDKYVLATVEDNYQNIFVFNGIGMIFVDEDATVALVNKEFERMTGYSRAEVEGKSSWTDFIVDPLDPPLLERIKQQWITGSHTIPETLKVKLRRKNNTFHEILLQMAVVPATTCIVASLIDITENKQFEDDIAALYRTLLDALPDAVAVINMEGKNIFISRNGLKLYGFDNYEESIGTSFDKTVAPDSLEEVTTFFRKLISTGGSDVIKNVKMMRKGEAWFAESWATAIKDTAGSIKGVIGITRDVTEQKRLQDERRALELQLFQSQKLETIGTLASGIAHDFNNILSGIIGYTELTLGSLHNSMMAEIHCKEILSTAERAQDLIAQILTFTRQTEFEHKEIVPMYVIKEVLGLLRASIPASIEFSTIINSKSKILGNATHLHQVLVNLCTNAAYAMRDTGGMIEIRLEDSYLEDEYIKTHPELHQGKHILLSISDTGCGIRPEMQSKIFEPFFTTKPPGMGTGLGLSVVRSIIKSLNGSIEVASKLDIGTVFTIVLPVLPDTLSSKDTVSCDRASYGSDTILLIDDETAVLDTLKLNLTGLGYAITAFSDGESAIDAYRKNPMLYDVVVTDYIMPRYNGIDIAGTIRAYRTDLPIVLCSGFIHDEVEEQAVRAGITTILKKPFRTAELVGVIRHLLNKC